jgi:hypothetical protein
VRLHGQRLNRPDDGEVRPSSAPEMGGVLQVSGLAGRSRRNDAVPSDRIAASRTFALSEELRWTHAGWGSTAVRTRRCRTRPRHPSTTITTEPGGGSLLEAAVGLVGDLSRLLRRDARPGAPAVGLDHDHHHSPAVGEHHEPLATESDRAVLTLAVPMPGPPLITVVVVAWSQARHCHPRAGRRAYPGGGEDLGAITPSAMQVQVADLRQVQRCEGELGLSRVMSLPVLRPSEPRRVGVAVRLDGDRFVSRGGVNAEWREEPGTGVVEDGLASGCCQDRRDQVRAGG